MDFSAASRNACTRHGEGQAEFEGGGDMREKNGANDGARTRDIQDHNLALYQLSYVRHRRRAS